MNRPGRMNAGARVSAGAGIALRVIACATIGNAPFASEKQGDPVNPEQVRMGRHVLITRAFLV